MSTVPSGARVALVLEPDDVVLELSERDSRDALLRHPDLLLQYRKHAGMTGTQGRLIVTDPDLVASILQHANLTP